MFRSGSNFRLCRAINPANKHPRCRRSRPRALPHHRDFAQMGCAHPGRPGGSPTGSTQGAPWSGRGRFSGSRLPAGRPGSCDSLGQRKFSPKRSNSITRLRRRNRSFLSSAASSQQLTLRLDALYLVAQEMTFRLTFADKSHYEHRFHIPDPTNSVEILFRLLQTHLETFRAEHPIVAVSLAARSLQTGAATVSSFRDALARPEPAARDAHPAHGIVRQRARGKAGPGRYASARCLSSRGFFLGIAFLA